MYVCSFIYASWTAAVEHRICHSVERFADVYQQFSITLLTGLTTVVIHVIVSMQQYAVGV